MSQCSSRHRHQGRRRGRRRPASLNLSRVPPRRPAPAASPRRRSSADPTPAVAGAPAMARTLNLLSQMPAVAAAPRVTRGGGSVRPAEAGSGRSTVNAARAGDLLRGVLLTAAAAAGGRRGDREETMVQGRVIVIGDTIDVQVAALHQSAVLPVFSAGIERAGKKRKKTPVLIRVYGMKIGPRYFYSVSQCRSQLQPWMCRRCSSSSSDPRLDFSSYSTDRGD